MIIIWRCWNKKGCRR